MRAAAKAKGQQQMVHQLENKYIGKDNAKKLHEAAAMASKFGVNVPAQFKDMELDATPAEKTLDQLVNDYGMEWEYTDVDFARELPYGYGYEEPFYGAVEAPYAYGAYGDWPYGPNPWDGDFYGAYAPIW